MKRDGKFWTGLALFQVVFGLAVFGATRAWYLDGGQDRVSGPGRASPAAAQGSITSNEIAMASALTSTGTRDPVEIAAQADNFFANRDYPRAAELYRRLLDMNPDNAETRNNLGLTLHYLGRSDEALRHLRIGTEAYPEHQRMWLTLGFVASQAGNVEEARAALMNAQAGDNEVIRQSATEMLAQLP